MFWINFIPTCMQLFVCFFLSLALLVAAILVCCFVVARWLAVAPLLLACRLGLLVLFVACLKCKYVLSHVGCCLLVICHFWYVACCLWCVVCCFSLGPCCLLLSFTPCHQQMQEQMKQIANNRQENEVRWGGPGGSGGV